MKIAKLLTIILVLNTGSALAQWEMGLNINAIAPSGELALQNYTWGFGGDYSLMSPTILNKKSDLKLQFGLSVGGSDNGKKSFKTNSQFEDGSLQFYNCIVNHQATARITYKFRPHIGVFADAIIGHTRFHSGVNETTDTEKTYSYNHTEVYSTRSLRYGGGIGGSYFINHLARLDLRFDYTYGGLAKFIDVSSAKRTDEGYFFEGKFSDQSNLTTVQLKFSWLLIMKK